MVPRSMFMPHANEISPGVTEVLAYGTAVEVQADGQ